MAGAQWSEFDLDKRVWSVPPERFKSNATHMVPLSDQALAVLLSVPHFTKGDYLFSTTLGERPVGGFSKAKARLDKLMGAPPWVIHDIRRTVRTVLPPCAFPTWLPRWSSATGARAFSESMISTHMKMRCVRLLSYGPLACATSSLRRLRM